MSLLEPYMEKHATLAAGTPLSLEADVGQSILVKDVQVYSPANTYIELKTEKTGVGVYRVKGNLGNHLAANYTDWYSDVAGVENLRPGRKTLLSWLISKGYMAGYPVAEGEKFSIQEVGASTPTAMVNVIYELYEAGDMTSEMPNGRKATEYVMPSYGQPTAVLAVNTETVLNVCMLPKEYITFPWADIVPAKTVIEILALMGSPVSVAGDATNYGIRSTYLKMIRERETLFDEDVNGVRFYQYGVGGTANDKYFGGGLCSFGNLSDMDIGYPFEGLVGKPFGAAEDFDVYIATANIGTTAGTPKTIAVADAEVGLVLRITKE